MTTTEETVVQATQEAAPDTPPLPLVQATENFRRAYREHRAAWERADAARIENNDAALASHTAWVAYQDARGELERSVIASAE